MSNGNSVTLVGNITRDPELRFTHTGQATTSFGLAVNRRWQNRQTQEWEEATSFFDVVCWREMAENAAESLARGLAGDRDRPARAAQLGDPRRRQAVQGRGRRRRDRPEHPLGDRAGHQERAARPGDGGRGASRRTAGAAAVRRRARDTDTARSPSSHGEEQRPRRIGTTVLEGRRPADQEEAVRPLQGPGGVGRLQGRLHAPQVHERPRQDPCPAGVGQLRPAPA